ncbi:hypothetical protein [Bifidobacterium adolescentis]|uniref:hypothetical protein n=1 Tax=Bifidobacterium adolescentis TaxID=1680 RepID=UPI00406431E7
MKSLSVHSTTLRAVSPDGAAKALDGLWEDLFRRSDGMLSPMMDESDRYADPRGEAFALPYLRNGRDDPSGDGLWRLRNAAGWFSFERLNHSALAGKILRAT